jgi:hypothetical protein
MGGNISSWTFRKEVKTIEEVRKLLKDEIEESLTEHGNSYSGEIGMLSVHDFTLKHGTISEDELHEEAETLEKRDAFIVKVKKFDKNKESAISFGYWSLHCLRMDEYPNPKNELSFSDKVGVRDRGSIEKMMAAYLAASDEAFQAEREYNRLVKIVSTLDSDEKFTASEINTAKRKFRSAKAKREKKLDPLKAKAQEIDDKLQPKTFNIVWGAAFNSPE